MRSARAGFVAAARVRARVCGSGKGKGRKMLVLGFPCFDII